MTPWKGATSECGIREYYVHARRTARLRRGNRDRVADVTPEPLEELVERVRSGVIVAEPPFEEALDELAERLKAAERERDEGTYLGREPAYWLRVEAQRDELVEALEAKQARGVVTKRPIQKRGGYQPSGSGPPPTEPPPKSRVTHDPPEALVERVREALLGRRHLLGVAGGKQADEGLAALTELAERLKAAERERDDEIENRWKMDAQRDELVEAKAEAEGIIHSALVTGSDPVAALRAAMDALGGDSIPIARAALAKIGGGQAGPLASHLPDAPEALVERVRLARTAIVNALNLTPLVPPQADTETLNVVNEAWAALPILTELAERLEVEMGAAKIALTEAARQIEAAEAQRDELVEALEVIAGRTYPATYLGEAKDGTRMYGGRDDASNFARAALAKVRPPEDDPFLPIGHPTC